MHLEVPESWEEERADVEEERQKYKEILDYQGGWRKRIFMRNRWQTGQMGVREEVERRTGTAGEPRRRQRETERSRETDKSNEVETSSVQVVVWTKSRRVLNRLDKELSHDILMKDER